MDHNLLGNKIQKKYVSMYILYSKNIQVTKQVLAWPCNVILWLNAWVDYDLCYKNNVKIDFCMIGVFF